MKRFYPVVVTALLTVLIVSGCGDDPPTGPGNGKDTTDTTKKDSIRTYDTLTLIAPCGRPTEDVGTNGFIVNGDFYRNQKFSLSSGTIDGDRTIDFLFNPEGTEYTVKGWAPIGTDSANITLVIKFPGRDANPLGFSWSDTTDGGSSVTLSIKRGDSTRTYYSSTKVGEGTTRVNEYIGGATPVGTFCGYLQDTLGHRIALHSGKFEYYR